jgi:hypothetical protein
LTFGILKLAFGAWKGDRPEKRERVEIPDARLPVFAAAEEQEFAGMVVDGAHRAIMDKFCKLLA